MKNMKSKILTASILLSVANTSLALDDYYFMCISEEVPTVYSLVASTMVGQPHLVGIEVKKFIKDTGVDPKKVKIGDCFFRRYNSENWHYTWVKKM